MFICVWVFVFLRNFILLCIYIKEEGRARRMEVHEKGATGATESDGNGPAGLAPVRNSRQSAAFALCVRACTCFTRTFSEI